MRTTWITRSAIAVSAVAALVVPAALVAPGADATASRQAAAPVTDLNGLKVLITNDDSAQGHDTAFGTDGKGLYALRAALCGAGADVLVVAPWGQQSGAAARMATPGFSPVPLTVQPITPPTGYGEDCASAPSGGAVFGVCQAADACVSGSPSASPADTVNIALEAFAGNFWSDGPDLVLSGINFGQNVGSSVNHSGTDGAVITAHEYGVPAIAFSAEVPLDLAQIPHTPFAATAGYAVTMIETLLGQGGLPVDAALNVNYPFVEAGQSVGATVRTVLGTSTSIGLSFGGEVTRSGGTYQLGLGAAPAETRENADTTALANNQVSVTPLDGDWTAAPAAPTSPSAQLKALARYKRDAEIGKARDKARTTIAAVRASHRSPAAKSRAIAKAKRVRDAEIAQARAEYEATVAS